MKIMYALAAFAVGGATAASAVFGTGPATAAPLDALLNSTCSFAQLDRALHAEHPDLAAKLDADPARKAMLQQVFSQPVSQRQAAIQSYLVAHPDQVAQMRQRAAANPAQSAQLQNVAGQLADTCHGY